MTENKPLISFNAHFESLLYECNAGNIYADKYLFIKSCTILDVLMTIFIFV